MIAYEELERALIRWKARRSGALETIEEAAELAPEETPEEVMEGNATPAAPTRLGAAQQPRQGTRELDFSDAEVDES
jgi:hypothetical protein